MNWLKLKSYNFQENNTSSINTTWLPFFRISISVICILLFLSLQFDFKSLIGADSYIPPDVAKAYDKQFIPSLYSISNFLNWNYQTAITIFRIIFVIPFSCVALNVFPKIFSGFALVFYLIFKSTFVLYIYGIDSFITLLLFYSFIFPFTHGLLFKNYKKKSSHTNTLLYLRVLQIHLSIIYFFSGLEKLLGFNWRNGESIWKVLHVYQNYSVVNVDNINPAFFIISGYTVLLIEMLYPIFMNFRKLRQIGLIAVIFLHLSIAILMGLYFFSAVMICFNLITFYTPYLKTHKAGEIDSASLEF